MRPAVGAGGVEGASEDMGRRDSPPLQHPQDGRSAVLGAAGLQLSDVDKTLSTC